MKDIEDLEKERVKLSNVIRTLTRGEILMVDFFVDYMGYRYRTKPNLIIYLAIPKHIKEDNFDESEFVETHHEIVEGVLTASGWGYLFNKNEFFVFWRII